MLESSARGALTITSLAEESRPPAAAGEFHGTRGRWTAHAALSARCMHASPRRPRCPAALWRTCISEQPRSVGSTGVFELQLRAARPAGGRTARGARGTGAAGRATPRASTRSSSAMSSSETSSPRVSMPSPPTGGIRPIGVSVAAPWPAQRANTQDSTREFSPKPGHRKRPLVVLAEPVDVEDLRQLRPVAAADLEPVGEVVGHVVAAERQHRERVEAQLADRAGGRGGLLRAHRPSRGTRRAPSRTPRSRAARPSSAARRTASRRSARPPGPPTPARSPGPARPAT